jgi:hypothetical protein
LQDLIRRPELKPAQCTLKETLQFQSGVTLKAGQKFDILEITADEIVVSAPNGRQNFSLTPSQTDVIAVANAEYSKMTTKQKELTYDAVLKRQDLWPYRLKVKDSFDIGNQRIKKGDTVYFMDVKNGQIVVVPSTFNTHFELNPQDTDILEQARTFIEQPNGAPGILAEELQGKLVNAITGQAVSLDANTPPKYYVIFHGARWCPYTQKFTPDVLKLYNAMKSKHPEFEVIYLPAEKSAAETQTYAKELNFPWPTIDFNQRNKLSVLAKIVGRSSLPDIQVVDRFGNLIIDNTQFDRDAVLKELEKLLSKSS